MGYITKRTLHHGSRFINKGEEVPENYKRLTEGLNRGWIIKKGGSAAPRRKPAKATKPPGPKPAPEVATEPVAPSLLIEDFEYLNPLAKASLKEEGVGHIGQLLGWTVERLDELPGIGPRLAARLLEDFEKHRESIQTGEEVEFENLPAEEDTVAYEVDPDGEDQDEGHQDDPAEV